MCIFPFNVETCHPEICREHLASSWQFSAKTEKYLLALTESDAGQTYKWDVRAKYLKEKGSKGLSFKETTQQLYSTTSQVIVFWLFWQDARVNLKHTWDWGIRLKHNSAGWWGTIRLLEMVEVGGGSEVWQRAPVLCQLRTTLWYCTMILYDIVLHLKC